MVETIPKRVVIIDDEDVVRNLISVLLASIGCEVVGEADNGEQGVALFAKTKPDLVLLDVSMPKMDGLQALRAMLQTDADARVVMLTGIDNNLIAEDAHYSGASGYIQKAMEPDALIKRLSEEIAKL